MFQVECNKGICFPEILRPLNSIVVAWIDIDKGLVDANQGFWTLFPRHSPDTMGMEELKGVFVHPKLTELTALEPREGGRVTKVFEGIMNLGYPESTVRSLWAAVYRVENTVLLVAEHDINMMETLSAKVLELNEEMASMQRTLRRSNYRLEKSEKRLRDMSLTDYLTGIPNRRYFMQRASQELASNERTGAPLCLAICDLDDFKQVNDTYGHDVGDRVLKWFADMVVSEKRVNDIFARTGGEEFVLLLPETGYEQGINLMRRIRQKMAGQQLSEVANAVTMSVGVLERCPGQQLEEMMSQADRAMYLAKEKGKDRIVNISTVGEHQVHE
jgi:diguanylate cyclase (GGDEF)-like protein